MGYGLTERITSGVRMQASVPVFTSNCARRQYADAGCAPFLEMILSSNGWLGRPHSDTCSGDSGGPVFSGDTNSIPKLIGVTSRPAPMPQIDREHQCGGGGIYTVLGRTDVRTWLVENGVPRDE
jgi:secreted trypsin-like serine protease